MPNDCSNNIPSLPPFSECGPTSKMEETINHRIIDKLAAEASGQRPYFAPPMTPWMQDFWAGRKLR